MAQFGMRDQASASKDPIESVERLQQVLQTEYSALDSFDQEILKEIHVVRDLKSNLRTVKKHLKLLKRLVEEDEKVIRSIYQLHAQSSTNRNVEGMKSKFAVFDQLGTRIVQTLRQSEETLRALLVEETHTLFAATEGNRNEMLEIDKEARTLLGELLTLNGNLMGHNQQLAGIKKELEALDAQRQNLRVSAERVKGFGR